MTNHYEMATSLMGTANIIKRTIDGELALSRKTPQILTGVTRMKEDLRHTLAMAKLHSTMAQIQEAQDLRAAIEQLAKDLNAEPASFEAHARTALELVEVPES